MESIITAIRKKEAENLAVFELYEEKQVRNIRYVRQTNENKKYILFGCGFIGEQAVDYFGKANVDFWRIMILVWWERKYAE